jgi:hypothetical protein
VTTPKKPLAPMVEDDAIASQLSALLTPAITSQENYGVAELRYDLCDQGRFWLPDLPHLSAIEMIRWIGNRNIPKLKIMNY